MLAESTSEPEVAEPSFVPFRGAAKRLDGKAPSLSVGPPPSSTSAGLQHLHTTRALSYTTCFGGCHVVIQQECTGLSLH